MTAKSKFGPRKMMEKAFGVMRLSILAESKSASVSQVIAATMEAKMIKPDEKVGASRKYARYLPLWA
jgi:hypothetical protein